MGRVRGRVEASQQPAEAVDLPFEQVDVDEGTVTRTWRGGSPTRDKLAGVKFEGFSSR